jgi:nicotinamide-nucleotide amidase
MPGSVTPTPARLAREVLTLARARGQTIATAESCTGGLVAAALTSIAGSSDVMDRGFVTYSNAAKTAMLGVPASLIAEVGAVSADVAAAMAEGALRASGASLAVSITGIAGPGGGSAAKPVGLVHFAIASNDGRVNPGIERTRHLLFRLAENGFFYVLPVPVLAVQTLGQITSERPFPCQQER